MRRVAGLTMLLTIAMAGATRAQAPASAAQLINAGRLPVSANAARREGASDSDVRSVLDAMRAAKVPANEARDILDTARAVRRQHGPVDNFGAFVQTKLAAGLRGRQLAAAIRAEHVAHGKGGGPAANAPGRGRANADAAAKSPPTKAKAPAAKSATTKAATTKAPTTKASTKASTKTPSKTPPTKAPTTKRPPARPNR
jgi:hypothetical protein